jgi:hypothetical protein
MATLEREIGSTVYTLDGRQLKHRDRIELFIAFRLGDGCEGDKEWCAGTVRNAGGYYQILFDDRLPTVEVTSGMQARWEQDGAHETS